MNARDVYDKSDGELTKRLYAQLDSTGVIGRIATCLFRAQKCSTRAKAYRGGNEKGRYRDMAYDRKAWSMKTLCEILEQHAEQVGIAWGWKRDPLQEWNPWVLYVSLPEDIGQCSFHSPTRYAGPDYPGDWDGQRMSEQRIISFCQCVLNGRKEPEQACLPMHS